MDKRTQTVLQTAKNAIMAISTKEVAMIAKNGKQSYAVTILGFIIDSLLNGEIAQAEMTTKVFCVYAKQILEADGDYVPPFLNDFIINGGEDDEEEFTTLDQ